MLRRHATAIRRNGQHVHRLPVIDHAGTLVGLISSLDVLAALVGAIEE